MIKLSICFILLLSISFSSMSQTEIKVTTERMAKGRTLWMINSLNIPISAFDMLYEINLEYQFRSDSIYNNTTESIPIKANMQSQLSYDHDCKLAKIFSLEQMDKYKQILIKQGVKQDTIRNNNQ